ncbi:MAG: NUDIX domain-containing protein [bacterium]|nr:NUDIX domain-containing protein [bacterium]
MRKEKLKEINSLIKELKCPSVVRCYGEPNFLKSEVYDCNLNGNIFKREKLVKNNLSGDAIVIFPVTSDNNVLLVAEPRVFTKELVGIGVPTGFVDALEEGSIAAIRELREETGYVTDDVCFLGGFYQDEDLSKWVVFVKSISDNPGVVELSEHALAIGKKDRVLKR